MGDDPVAPAAARAGPTLGSPPRALRRRRIQALRACRLLSAAAAAAALYRVQYPDRAADLEGEPSRFAAKQRPPSLRAG